MVADEPAQNEENRRISFCWFCGWYYVIRPCQ
jgi:hypothetical protein